MPTRDYEARLLARKHYQVEPGITQIFTLRDPPEAEALPDTPIKLLEVNANTVATGVVPLRFGPAPAEGMHFPSVIVEVTPAEFRTIRAGKLPLPGGWRLGELIPKPAANSAG
jgi:hypothetical protein